jgi:Domain of unknown function (DUF5666)
MRSIAGFGSVIINGIKFDDSVAVVQVNGVATNPSDLRLGMVASVQGTRNVDLVTGTAAHIDVWSIAQGPVSQVQSGQFKVAGMTVMTDASTVFEGVASTSALANLGSTQRVTVWGLQSGADGSGWRATRLAMTTANTVVSTGLVTASGAQRSVNGITLSGNAVSGNSLTAGQLVRVQGNLSANGTTLQVDTFKVFDTATTSAQQGVLEIEGVITASLSATRFILGAVEVDATGAALTGAGQGFTVGTRVEVEGMWQGRILKATKIEFEGEVATTEAEIDGKIEQFTSLSNFVVRGQRCDGSAVKQVNGGKFADLRVGVRVQVHGNVTGDLLKLYSIELSN